MSLQDPTAKMSKSDEDPRGSVLLLDSADTIMKKFKSAVTDSEREVRYDRESKAGISNLLDILSIYTGRKVDDLVDEYVDAGYGAFKIAVAEAVVEGLSPIRHAFNSFDDADVSRIMSRGALDARTRAEQEMAGVRKLVGLGG